MLGITAFEFDARIELHSQRDATEVGDTLGSKLRALNDSLYKASLKAKDKAERYYNHVVHEQVF